MALVLLTGGARSGKSQLAVALASRQRAPVTFVATGEAGDAEMAERIQRHRQARPASWTTVEEPLDLAGVVARVPAESFLLIDCLSLWVANLVSRELPDEQIVARARDAASLVAARPGGAVAVTNEVGSSIVPDNRVARRYRDLLGTVNANWAAASTRAALVVAGHLLPLSRPDEIWTEDPGWIPS